MKSTAIIVSLVMFLMSFGACSIIQPTPNPNQQIILARMAGRTAGYELAKKDPIKAQNGIPVCDKIIAAQNTTEVALLLVQLAPSITSDPFLAVTLADVMALIGLNLQIPTVTDEQLPLIKAAAEGYKQGVVIAGV